MVMMNGDGGNTTAAAGDDDGLPAYSHHHKIPPWWECVRSLDDDYDYDDLCILVKVFSFCSSESTASGNLCT